MVNLLLLRDPDFIEMKDMADAKRVARNMRSSLEDYDSGELGVVIPLVTGTETPVRSSSSIDSIVINTILGIDHKCVPEAPTSSIIQVGGAEYAQLSIRVCLSTDDAMTLLEDAFGGEGFTTQQRKKVESALLHWIDDAASVYVSFCGPESAVQYRSRVAVTIANEEYVAAEQLKRDRAEWERLNKIFGEKPAAKKSTAKKS